MPHATRLSMHRDRRQLIEKVIAPAPTIFDQQQVLLSCGHTVWVSGNKDRSAYCPLCPAHSFPNQTRRRFP